jgi:hypothetical protein
LALDESTGRGAFRFVLFVESGILPFAFTALVAGAASVVSEELLQACNRATARAMVNIFFIFGKITFISHQLSDRTCSLRSHEKFHAKTPGAKAQRKYNGTVIFMIGYD